MAFSHARSYQRWMTSMAAVTVGLLALSVARADVESGPAVGDKVSKLAVDAVTGGEEGKQVDYAEVRGEKPTVYLFVHPGKFSRPMARLMKTLDSELKKSSAEAYIVAIWLTDDAQATKDYLPKAQQSLQLENTALTVFSGNVAGPDGWGLNPDADLTAVVAAKSKVAARFGYVSANETLVTGLREALEKAVAAQ